MKHPKSSEKSILLAKIFSFIPYLVSGGVEEAPFGDLLGVLGNLMLSVPIP